MAGQRLQLLLITARESAGNRRSLRHTPRVMCFQNSDKTVILSKAPTHIYRLTEGLQRAVEGPRRCFWAMLLAALLERLRLPPVKGPADECL